MTGRFAPSPSGRMHLGNIYAALMSWLAARASGGRWILRIEDLDPGRSRPEYARLIEDDLRWLGLHWDAGGLDDPQYVQSRRGEVYNRYFDMLRRRGLVYPCTCRRADILATQAPHQSDGRVIYPGTCRPSEIPCIPAPESPAGPHSWRLAVPDRVIEFEDAIAGVQKFNLARDCGDFIVRRSDGAWAYQLAVTVDDSLMGIDQVVRGQDLLLSAAQQIYLRTLLFPDLAQPQYMHLPLLCAPDGRRLSKRDSSMAMDALRRTHTPASLLGLVAAQAKIIPGPRKISLEELLDIYISRSA